MKPIFLLLLIPLTLFTPFAAFSQNFFETISLVDDKVQILVPKEWAPMSDQLWAAKYPGRTMPMLALTDENGEVDLIADLTQQPATAAQIADFKAFQIQQLQSSRPDLEFLSEGIKDIHGRPVGYFKFLSRAVDQKVFNYYFFTVVDGKIMLFTFNCLKSLKRAWERSADRIMASLFVKD